MMSAGGLTDDVFIDDEGFDLGVPSALECWKQQAHLLAAEIGDLQRDLSSARNSIHKLVLMHSEACKERDAFMLELAKTKRDMSEHLRLGSIREAQRLNAYGSAHTIGYSTQSNDTTR